MKKVFIALFLVLTMTGCVNTALLKSSQAYYDSTKPYIEMAISSKKISKEEKESVKLNMAEFQKMLDHYAAEKAWYEF